MKKEVYIFDVSEKNFKESVIQNSSSIPVFVEFMGFWSEPCITMAALLESLAGEFASQFILAKVDIDEQMELRKKYDIQNVPTLKIFVNGDVIATEEGQLTEDECRDLLKHQGIFHESDELRMQARELHLSGDTQQAFILLTQAIKRDPQNTRIAMDMVQIFLDQKMLNEANALFNKLPPAVRDSNMGKSLARQLAIANQAEKTDGIPVLLQRISNNASDLDAIFDYAVCLLAEYETLKAMEQLFIILRTNVEYKDGAARQLVMATINSLKENDPVTAKELQQKLNNMLAS